MTVSTTQPGLRADLGLGVTPFGTVAWTNDISSLIRQRTTIRRGRRSVFGDVETGRAMITLDNRSRAYDPENTSSLYTADLLPMVPIRIRAYWDSAYYPLFQGYVLDWRPRYTGGTMAFIDLDCRDGFEPLARLPLGTATVPLALAEDAVPQRIIDTIDAAGWPGSGVGLSGGGTGPRIIDNTSTIRIQASSLESVPALEHLLTVARSVDGVFFVDNAGNVVFQDRSFRDALTSVGTWGDADDHSELPYSNLITGYGASTIYNRVEWQNQALPGETRDVVISEDATSQGAYLTRLAPSRTSMLLVDDSDAQDIADGIIGRFKDPKVRAERIEMDPAVRPIAAWPLVLGADVSTRLTIRRRGLNGGSMLELEGFVEGLDWDITQTEKGGTKWKPAFDISTL